MSEPYPGKYDKEHNGEYRELFDPVLEFIKEKYPGAESDLPGLVCSSLLDCPGELYWVNDTGKILFANNTACSKLGYKPGDLPGKNLGEIEEAKEGSLSFDDLRSGLKDSTGTLIYDSRHKRADNTFYDVQSEAGFISYNGMSVIGICSRPVPEEKKDDAVLADYENEKTAIINAVHENVIYYDTDLSVRWINDKPAATPGKKLEDLIGKKCYSFWGLGEDFCDECTIKKVIKTGTSITEEKQKSSGRWVEISGYPVFNSSGKVKGAVESILDITERKKTEDALKESERQYLELFTTMTNAFAYHEVITDGNGNPSDFRYLRVNPAFEKMTGIKSSEIIGKRYLEYFPGGRKTIIERFGNIALNGGDDSFVDYNPALNQYHSIYIYSPKRGTFAAIYSDITDLVKLKKEQKVSLEQINRNFEDLAILNDEIRNPLQVIKGYVLLEDFAYSKEILAQIDTIDKLVNRLDKRWLESNKIREFLKKHYDFDQPDNIPIQYPDK
ncbi:putative PAS/PAC sensor protein [Methanolacinia petrolearia DSM 11571]|uniref:Putative PAS/PAC sensor protein n=1 Tax=Methanolacinia petrolearia (strain DSM 11571 / OCM 486 / SEBR 4847) TaxID=679926 RepID=E1RG18_METP4|nr:PAS domain-containing protein [Methanolacinia petrolearia]ADN36253.1 putative PAS/PAC sensor protein [Methanolacinia petrolearia DSM 11571]